MAAHCWASKWEHLIWIPHSIFKSLFPLPSLLVPFVLCFLFYEFICFAHAMVDQVLPHEEMTPWSFCITWMDYYPKMHRNERQEKRIRKHQVHRNVCDCMSFCVSKYAINNYVNICSNPFLATDYSSWKKNIIDSS